MTFRSEKLRRLVNGLACVNCGANDGTVVPAHANFGKGGAIKASDATIMALCCRCHTMLDQGGKMSKVERRLFEREMNLRTLHAFIERGRLIPEG